MKKKKKSVGRPSFYKPEYCDMIVEFFDIEPFEEKEIPHYKAGKLCWTDFREVSNPIPSIVKFGKHIGVSHDAIENWAKKYPEFGVALSRAKEIQKDIIITNGLKGLYNPTFAVFAMKNIAKWKDTQNLEHGGKVDAEVSLFSLMAKATEARRARDTDSRLEPAYGPTAN